MASEHSPLPWVVGRPDVDGDARYSYGIRDREDWVLADVLTTCAYSDAAGRELAEANAEFIVRCVNSHHDLLEALKHCERFCPCGARPESPHSHHHVSGCPVEAAIAKAEGR